MTADPRAVEIIATATAQHHLDPDWSDADRHDRCVCGGWAEGEMEPGWDDHMADVSVAALDAAGWSLLPPGGQSDLYVVIKSVPGRAPEIMADMATDSGELNHWLAALREDPNGDRLATYTGYRLALPAPTQEEP